MADNIPAPPGGAIPPKPAEAVKVQPKKETVRINLPPKPTASPTIKLPTLPSAAAAPAHAAAPVAAPAAVSAAPAHVAAPAPARVATAPRPAAAPTVAPAPRPAPPPTISTFDKVLAIAAMVVALVVVAHTFFYLMPLFTPNPG